MDHLVEAAERHFLDKLGRPPRWVVAAPGRVNLIGEHTDYNGGYVFPMAIDRHVVIAADRVSPSTFNGKPNQARLFSTELGRWATILVEGEIRPDGGGWSSYVQGTVAGCLAKGLAPGGFEAVIHSDVPFGGGLSSSAALEVATATLVEAITGRQLDPLEKVLLCQKAEHEFAGMPCGIMDQFSSVMARADHLMLLDCRSQDAENVPIADPDITVLIANTNVKHELTGGEYAQRRSQCEEAARVLGVATLRDATRDRLNEVRKELGEVHFRRARHVISEIERTARAARAIKRSDWHEVGALMYDSHKSLRDDYEVSCAELDLLVELARSLGSAGGVIGSRMTGGGFGGCTVSLVRAESVEPVTRKLHEGYLADTGIAPAIFATRPAQGARILRG
jgi:galactokinase